MNVDETFENVTINEIKQTIWKTWRDIENKKEELRWLVGERYRDVIETADTISQMKIHSQTLSDNLFQLAEESRNLHKNLFLTYKGKTKGSTTTESIRKQSVKGGVAAQLKFILNIPERAYDALEQEQRDCLMSATLLLSGQHVTSRLRLLGEADSIGVDATAIVLRQTTTFNRLRQIITASCKEQLVDSNLCNKSAVRNLLALSILGEFADTSESLVVKFLQLRKEALEQFLLKQQSESSVKNLLVSAVEIILNSLHLVMEAFSYDKNVSIQQVFQEYENFSIKDFKWVQFGIYLCLNESVTAFQPIRENIPPSIQQSFHLDNVDWIALSKQWLQECVHILNNYMKELLVFCNTPASVCQLRLAMNQLLHDPNSAVTTSSSPAPASMPGHHKKQAFDISILQDSVNSAILLQLKTVFLHDISEAFTIWRNAMDKHIEVIASSSHTGTERVTMPEHDWYLRNSDCDMTSLIWCDIDEDYIRTLASQALYDAPTGLLNTKSSSAGVKQKEDALTLSCSSLQGVCKLYSPMINRASLNLNKAIETVAGSQVAECSSQENQQINAILRDCLLEQLTNCSNHFKNKLLQKPHEMAQECLNNPLSLFVMSRYLTSLLDNCSAISSLFRAPKLSHDEWSLRLSRDEPQIRTEFLPEWTEQKTQLLQLTNDIVDTALQLLAERHLREFELVLKELITTNSVQQYALAWNVHEIMADHVEDDNNADSERMEGALTSTLVYVPSGASLPVHNLLMNLCQSLSDVGGHVISRNCMSTFQEYLCRQLVSLYHDCLALHRQKNGSLSQTLALQLLFDSRFMFSLLSRYNPGGSSEISKTQQSLQEQLCSAIDPFDLEVCAEPLREHLQTHLSRCQQQYAFLSHSTSTGWLRFNSDAALTTTKPASTRPHQHTVLHMLSANEDNKSACPRFTLLPVALHNVRRMNEPTGQDVVLSQQPILEDKGEETNRKIQPPGLMTSSSNASTKSKVTLATNHGDKQRGFYNPFGKSWF